MGLEPIPKLNFSTCHDYWLGPYARMVSTPKYYEVCQNLIAEVIDLFDKPRYFHLGMDEEEQKHQRWFEHVVLRQYGLWWREFEFFVKQVEKGQGLIWSDYVWEHRPLLGHAQVDSPEHRYYGSLHNARDEAEVKRISISRITNTTRRRHEQLGIERQHLRHGEVSREHIPCRA
jgi:hypothetical protein